MTPMATQGPAPSPSGTSLANGRGAAAKDSTPTTGFALLMQGQLPPQTAALGRADPLKSTDSDTAVPGGDVEIAVPEGIDTETAEGLIALMEHVVVVLEDEGGAITAPQVMKAFAGALGETPVASFADLEAVVGVADETLAPALQDRMASAIRSAPHSAQLSLVSADVPVVSRAELRNTARPIAAVEIASKPVSEPLQQIGTQQDASPAQSSAFSVKAAVAAGPSARASAATPLETAPRDIPAFAPSVQAPAELQRLQPTPMAAVASAHTPQASPDDQLRRHVSQQIRSIDLKDNKFRFSLAPHGRGAHRLCLGRLPGRGPRGRAVQRPPLQRDRDRGAAI